MEANCERRIGNQNRADNVMDEYAVCVKKNISIVEHLPFGKNGKFAKMIFYFLRADKEVNLSDGDGMQVPCKLKNSGSRKMMEILCKKFFSVVQKRANRNLLLYLRYFFHLLSQKSDALNSLIPFSNSKAFSLSMIPSIGTFWLLFPTNQWKTALSIWS